LHWTVKGYAVRGGESVIDEWARSVPPKVLAKFDSRLAFLVSRTIREWDYEYAHQRKGTGGVFEIKFEMGNIAYRPLFCQGPSAEDLTVLIFAEEHNDKLKPISADDTAEARMKEVLENPSKAIEYEY